MTSVNGLHQPVTIELWEGAVLRPIIAADHKDAEKTKNRRPDDAGGKENCDEIMETHMKREAKAVLSAADIAVDQDSDSLNPVQLAAIRIEAEAAYRRKHDKPMPLDSVTYIRKRYDLLQLRARSIGLKYQ
jgi:hypothetical protein